MLQMEERQCCWWWRSKDCEDKNYISLNKCDATTQILDAHSVYGFVSNTVELLCEMEVTKQGSTMVLQDTRWYAGDHFHSLNRVDSCCFISSVVDWTTSWYFSSGSWGDQQQPHEPIDRETSLVSQNKLCETLPNYERSRSGVGRREWVVHNRPQ